eukprot:jgi/Bigna1/38448/e_gw1.26.62.1
MGQDIKEEENVVRLRQFFETKGREACSKDFKFIKSIGQGTFGHIRLATLNIDGQQSPFALKILRKSEVLRTKQLDHVLEEKANLMAMSHNFIVKLFHTFKDKDNLYLVLEYAIGGDLFGHLRKKGKLDNETSRYYAAEITVALAYMHSKGIVHRDVKPENILIDGKGHLKLTDLGFSKKIENGKRTWTLCGTPEYLAPEIIHSVGHTFGVDWWALGILIFEMLAGFPPFYDEQPFKIYQKICVGIGKVEFPKSIDTKARSLIKSLLETYYPKRLGCLKNGGYDVRKHKWFKGLKFKRIINLEIPPPYIPKVDSPIDTRHFSSDVEDNIDEKEIVAISQPEEEKFNSF